MQRSRNSNVFDSTMIAVKGEKETKLESATWLTKKSPLLQQAIELDALQHAYSIILTPPYKYKHKGNSAIHVCVMKGNKRHNIESVFICGRPFNYVLQVTKLLSQKRIIRFE